MYGPGSPEYYVKLREVSFVISGTLATANAPLAFAKATSEGVPCYSGRSSEIWERSSTCEVMAWKSGNLKGLPVTKETLTLVGVKGFIFGFV